MSLSDRKFSKRQLSDDTITYLDSKLTKMEKSLLMELYKYQPIQHKHLAEALGIQTSGLSNLMSKINQLYEGFIEFEFIGRNKFYSLSPVAKTYTEIKVLPKEAARKNALNSFLNTDPLSHEALEFLRRFQEFEGDDWYIVLDDLLFVETQNISVANIDFKEENYQNYNKIKEETYQNYTNFKKFLINLVTQYGKQSVQIVFSILDEKILNKRIDSLLSSLLDDFYQMEPLFQLEKKDLQDAYDIIDRIFFERCPEIFRKNFVMYPNPLPTEYYSVDHAIGIMINEFKDNNYDKAVSIKLWEKKFHTREHFSCISYIAEKCNTVYFR